MPKKSLPLTFLSTCCLLLGMVTTAAAQTTSSSILGPVKIDGFTVTNDQLFGLGRVMLPGGSIVPFSTPASISGGPLAAAGTTTSCTVLSLLLGPVDLTLLGLQAHVDQVSLLVTAEPGAGNLLGNLLCSSKSKKTNKNFLTDVASGLTQAFSNSDLTFSSIPVSAAAGGIVNTIDFQELSTTLASTGVSPGLAACPILDLQIQEVDVLLLGLHIQSLAPIALNVTATPGDGNLLGNLFCQVAHLLDGTSPASSTVAISTVNSILGTLTGGTLATLPTTGLLSPTARTALGGAVSVTTASTRQAPTPQICTVLHLVLGPVDLNLLGLIVHLERVDLLATAESGPNNLLGNLLCPEKGSTRTTSLTELRQGLRSLAAQPAHAVASGVSTMTTSATTASLATTATIAPGSLPILHLEIQQLDLFLLGLRVQTLAPVVLDVSAEPGPGNLLGNLFAFVAGLLNQTAALEPNRDLWQIGSPPART